MNTVGVEIVGSDELVDRKIEAEDYLLKETEDEDLIYSSLANYITSQFQISMDAKENSGIERRILDSQRAYNGNYNPADLAQIKNEGGSQIFMNLTATKCRAASSWIKDILMPAKERVFSISSTPAPDLPQGIKEEIEAALEKEFQELIKPPEQTQPQQGQPQGQPQQQGQPQRSTAEAQQTLRELNQSRRDILDAIDEEIHKESAHSLKRIENLIADQLVEGEWTDALTQFIDDFCVFPVAVMKGPVVTRRKKLAWVDGKPTPIDDFVFLNKRVNPLDIYPSPDATSIQDGSIIEHLRMSVSELSSLRGIEGYNDEKIEEALETESSDYLWLSTGIEDEKSDEEMRGNSTEANKGVVHGLHFFGPVSGKILKEWGVEKVCLESNDPYKMWEVEAILVGNDVIKCIINEDPLARRPYYKASFQNIPGSFWGRSIPELMSDIQRMCNACARSLSNNMALSSGPQVELYIDRLADAGDVEEIYPRKIWQLLSDKTGGGGRALNFTMVPSNAKELLVVYQDFELRADDVTSIPRYAYGNEKVGGAAQTASGLSMLLESASKGIKDAIRHIDDGLIKPRVEREFYWTLIKNPEIRYTGDVQVITKGSSALTVKGSEQLKRNEFLQITANQIDQQIMGVSGRAALLREVGMDLGIDETIVPTRLEIKASEKKQGEAHAAQMAEAKEMEMQKDAMGLQATEIQITGQERMHQATQALKQAELEYKKIKAQQDGQLKVMELEQRDRATTVKSMDSQQTVAAQEQTKVDNVNKELAFKIQTGQPGI